METMEMVAQLMALATRTAPKAGGKDFVELKVISGDVLQTLGDEMIKYGAASGRKDFDRDGKNIASAGAVLLLALKNPGVTGLNCGACGVDKCAELKDHEGD